MRPQGVFPDLLRSRFKLACRRYGITNERLEVDCSKFVPPTLDGQMRLF